MLTTIKPKLFVALALIAPILAGCRSVSALLPKKIDQNGASAVANSLVTASHERSSTTKVGSHENMDFSPSVDAEVGTPLTDATPLSNNSFIESAADAQQQQEPQQPRPDSFDDAIDGTTRPETMPASPSQAMGGIDGSEAHQALPPAKFNDSRSPDTRVAQLIISGVRPGRGKIKIAIFTDAKTFPQPDGASQVFNLNPDKAQLELPIHTEPPFAVAAYQDINGDGVLSRNRLGMPVEPFAFSNNAVGQRGPPTFDKAKVDVPHTTAPSPIIPINLP